jgi:hypothetical protein
MTYLVAKALLSGILVMVVSEVARYRPGIGGLIASLPLVSVLAGQGILRRICIGVAPKTGGPSCYLAARGRSLPDTGRSVRAPPLIAPKCR